MMFRRLVWLDIAKGIAILLMVIGHSSIPSFLSNLIWAFHMPLFFIASGWATNWKNTELLHFAKKKVRTLLVPFIVYSLLVLLIQITLGWIEFNNWIFNGWVSYGLWFIPVLFLASIFAKIIYSLKNRFLLLGCTFLLAALSGILSYYKIQLPWNFSSVPFAAFLIIIGAEFKQHSRRIEESKLRYILILFFITAIISQFWRLDLCFNSILPFLPLTIGALTGTLTIFMISNWIYNNNNFVSVVLQVIGKETFIIVAFSQIIIMLLNEYFSFNSVLKYFCLLLILIALKHIKDGINKIANLKIL